MKKKEQFSLLIKKYSKSGGNIPLKLGNRLEQVQNILKIERPDNTELERLGDALLDKVGNLGLGLSNHWPQTVEEKLLQIDSIIEYCGKTNESNWSFTGWVKFIGEEK